MRNARFREPLGKTRSASELSTHHGRQEAAFYGDGDFRLHDLSNYSSFMDCWKPAAADESVSQPCRGRGRELLKICSAFAVVILRESNSTRLGTNDGVTPGSGNASETLPRRCCEGLVVSWFPSQTSTSAFSGEGACLALPFSK